MVLEGDYWGRVVMVSKMNKKEQMKAEFMKRFEALNKNGRDISHVLSDTIGIMFDVLAENIIWSEGSGQIQEGWYKIFGLESLVPRACSSYMCDKEATWSFQKGDVGSYYCSECKAAIEKSISADMCSVCKTVVGEHTLYDGSVVCSGCLSKL